MALVLKKTIAFAGRVSLINRVKLIIKYNPANSGVFCCCAVKIRGLDVMIVRKKEKNL